MEFIPGMDSLSYWNLFTDCILQNEVQVFCLPAADNMVFMAKLALHHHRSFAFETKENYTIVVRSWPHTFFRMGRFNIGIYITDRNTKSCAQKNRKDSWLGICMLYATVRCTCYLYWPLWKAQ